MSNSDEPEWIDDEYGQHRILSDGTLQTRTDEHGEVKTWSRAMLREKKSLGGIRAILNDMRKQLSDY